jgi:hypothetical protein
MRIIALLFAFVLAGCTGNRLNAETSTIAVAAPAPPVAAAFAAMGLWRASRTKARAGLARPQRRRI